MISAPPGSLRVGMLLAVILSTSGVAGRIPQTISRSGQFFIFDNDSRLRGAVASAAEEVKTKLLTTLRLRDEWSLPLLLNLRRPEANLPEIAGATLSLTQTDSGPRIQLDLIIDENFDPATLKREVLSALILEMGFRKRSFIRPGMEFARPPEWLLDGLLRVDNLSAELSDAWEQLASHPVTLSSFLQQRPELLDSQSRAVYGACGLALVQMLLQRPSGATSLASYISDFGSTSNDPLTELARHFPEFVGNPEDLERKWRSSLALSAEAQRFVLLSFEETEARLDQCLCVKIAKDRAGFIDLDHAASAKKPALDTGAIRALEEQLLILSARAHPLLRPAVADCQKALAFFARKKMRDVARSLAAAAALRRELSGRMEQVGDYLNWFEATQANTASGIFREYFHAAEGLDSVRHRHDPFSVYLDAMESQMQ